MASQRLPSRLVLHERTGPQATTHSMTPAEKRKVTMRLKREAERLADEAIAATTLGKISLFSLLLS